MYVTRTDFYLNFLVCLVCIVIQKYDWWKEIRKVCEFQLKALGHTHPCHAYWMGFTHCIYIHVFPKGTWTCSEILWHFTVQQCHKIIFFPEFNNFFVNLRRTCLPKVAYSSLLIYMQSKILSIVSIHSLVLSKNRKCYYSAEH